MVRTLGQRKREEVGRRRSVIAGMADRLRAFAGLHGGRYLLYGSVARRELRCDSDVDLIVDFPAESEAEAWRLAETLCLEGGMEADIIPLAWCAPEFVAKILPSAILLT